MNFLIFIFLILVMAGCSTLPKTFSTENIMKVKQGMASDEILKMFGEPTNVNQAVCGGKEGPSWTCTTWEYGNTSYEHASFTFSGAHGAYILNDFKVDRGSPRQWYDY